MSRLFFGASLFVLLTSTPGFASEGHRKWVGEGRELSSIRYKRPAGSRRPLIVGTGKKAGRYFSRKASGKLIPVEISEIVGRIPKAKAGLDHLPGLVASQVADAAGLLSIARGLDRTAPNTPQTQRLSTRYGLHTGSAHRPHAWYEARKSVREARKLIGEIRAVDFGPLGTVAKDLEALVEATAPAMAEHMRRAGISWKDVLP